MTKTSLRRIAVLLLCVGFPYLVAAAMRRTADGAIKTVDFGQLYYQARCALQHQDPYDPPTVLRLFEAEGGRFSTTSPREAWLTRNIVTLADYPPTALLIVAPLSLLPWPLAEAVWIGLITVLLVAEGFAVWDLAGAAPVLAGGLAGFIALNCVVLLVSGNPAGVVVPFCVLAAWCWLTRRWEAAGVAMLAVSLVVKPHDAGFVWLYFLLAGRTGRTRALQSLALAGVLGVCAAVWIAPSSPHWLQEMHNNLARLGVRGGFDDPGPTGLNSAGPFPIISLQSAVSTLKDDPNCYDPVTYTVAGGLILIWVVAVLRKHSTREGTLLALAAISILTLLPVYHRPDDAKLLLLAIPACAMLWAGKGAARWVALGMTTAAIFFTSDFPLIFLGAMAGKLNPAPSTAEGKLMLLLLHPAPLVLLAAGCFYLWVYIRYKPSANGLAYRETAVVEAAEAAT